MEKDIKVMTVVISLTIMFILMSIIFVEPSEPLSVKAEKWCEKNGFIGYIPTEHSCYKVIDNDTIITKKIVFNGQRIYWDNHPES